MTNLKKSERTIFFILFVFFLFLLFLMFLKGGTCSKENFTNGSYYAFAGCLSNCQRDCKQSYPFYQSLQEQGSHLCEKQCEIDCHNKFKKTTY
jgi:hypothetical protein